MYEAYIKKINIYFARRRMQAARLFLPLISSFSSTEKKTSPREQKRWEQRESLFHRKNVCSIWLNSKILSWRKNPTKNFDDFIERTLFRKKKSATVSQPASHWWTWICIVIQFYGENTKNRKVFLSVQAFQSSNFNAIVFYFRYLWTPSTFLGFATDAKP